MLLVENDEPKVPATAVTPTIGMHPLAAGAVVTATDWTDAERNLQGECLGYSVRYYDETSGTWGEAATSEETSFTCPDEAGGVWITWRWNVSLLGTAYSDDFLQTTDPAVRGLALPTGVAYVFTNAAAGEVSVLVRDDMRLERFLVVGGGGCGGQPAGGGGGGGGVIDGDEPVVLEAGSQLTIAVGAGGFGKASEQNNGGNTSFAFGGRSYVAVGGGSGAYWGGFTGYAGGSGGGATAHAAGGAGTAGQGFSGGGWPGGDYASGGGGATEAGRGGSAAKGGDGGEGLASDITGVSVVYGSGGGGSGIWGNSAHGKGGTNAGDGGGNDNAYQATAGVDGTGGGGGGDCYKDNVARVGKGGCGTVILLLKPKTAMAIVDNNQPLVPETAIEPVAGAHAFAEGAVMRALDWSDPETLVKGRCIGYEVRPYNPATGDWGEPVTSDETVFTVPSSLQDGFKLIWRWELSLEDDACFRDRLAECSTTPTLKKRIRLDDETCEYVYVFSDPDSRTVSLLLKKEATLLRTLVVAGGGGGASAAGGGGGGGGVIAADVSMDMVPGALFRLSVGAGGTGGENGGDSSLAFADRSVVAVGGGAGGSWGAWTGATGGSGGGAVSSGNRGGNGTPGQGHEGGSYPAGNWGCGGGGASQSGDNGSEAAGGKGGEGLASDITGESVVYGSGGGGGGSWGARPGGAGGVNAGAGGGSNNGNTGGNGVDGTGGGGGADSNNLGKAGKGGSGTVILRLRVKESRTGLTLILR